jgi:fido (protein-threonine AMPylation protein)
MAAQRADEPLPSGRLSVRHYRAIHHHLFQDVYEWAGDFGTVRISKDGSMFCYPDYILHPGRNAKAVCAPPIKCNEPQAAGRAAAALSLTKPQSEYVQQQSDKRMIIEIGNSFIRLIQ